jgi:diguanylate cyclase (GGDEF)-like protein
VLDLYALLDMNVSLVTRKKNFVILLAVLLAVGFLATTFISHHVARNSLERQLEDEMLPLTSDNIYSEIQRDLLRPILISSLMARDTFVRDWALSGEQDAVKISNFLEEIQQKFGAITAYYISDKTLKYYHPTGVIKTLDSVDPLDQWYFGLRSTTDEYDINVDHDTVDRSRLNIFINYRVFDYNGEFIGVTGIGLSVDAVVKLINSYQRRYNRQIYFVDRQGDVRLHGDNIDLNSNLFKRAGQDAFATKLLTSPSTSTSYVGDDGEDVYINSRLVPEFDWFLIVEQMGGSGKETIDRALVFNILVALGITLVVLAIAHFTLRGYQRQLVEMATIDKLTASLNRGAFENLFGHAIKVATRRSQALALLMIDLDHFKRVNDQYGHQAGDAVLQNVASAIKSVIRDTDTLCRWGGEEFMVLLEDCPLSQATDVAEKIRHQASERTFTFGRDSIAVTLSVGVVAYQAGESMESYLSRADKALYAAKREGRNRVAVG